MTDQAVKYNLFIGSLQMHLVFQLFNYTCGVFNSAAASTVLLLKLECCLQMSSFHKNNLTLFCG